MIGFRFPSGIQLSFRLLNRYAYYTESEGTNQEKNKTLSDLRKPGGETERRVKSKKFAEEGWQMMEKANTAEKQSGY